MAAMNRNPLFDHYDAKFDWRNDEYCEYDAVVQLAIEDGLIAVDDERFCEGANSLLKRLFIYIHRIPRGLHYARLILKQRESCVSPDLIGVCESLVRFEWPTDDYWTKEDYSRSCRWPCPYKEYYYSPWNPIMFGGGIQFVKDNQHLRIDLNLAKAKVQAEAVVNSEIPF